MNLLSRAIRPINSTHPISFFLHAIQRIQTYSDDLLGRCILARSLPARFQIHLLLHLNDEYRKPHAKGQ